MRIGYALKLKGAVRTENVNDLMLNHILNLGTSYGEVASGVEYGGLVCEYAADTCGHSKADIGVDVDLTNCHGCSLSELLLGNTDSVGHLAAEGVDLSNKVLRNAGCAVKNDRESGKSLFDLLENIEAERGRNKDALLVSGTLLGSELVCAVGGDRKSTRLNSSHVT